MFFIRRSSSYRSPRANKISSAQILSAIRMCKQKISREIDRISWTGNKDALKNSIKVRVQGGQIIVVWSDVRGYDLLGLKTFLEKTGGKRKVTNRLDDFKRKGISEASNQEEIDEERIRLEEEIEKSKRSIFEKEKLRQEMLRELELQERKLNKKESKSGLGKKLRKKKQQLLERKGKVVSWGTEGKVYRSPGRAPLWGTPGETNVKKIGFSRARRDPDRVTVSWGTGGKVEKDRKKRRKQRKWGSFPPREDRRVRDYEDRFKEEGKEESIKEPDLSKYELESFDLFPIVDRIISDAVKEYFFNNFKL